MNFNIAGLLWMECKQLYHSGLRSYLLDNYNWIDLIVLSHYLSSYLLRFLVDHWIKLADKHYNGTTRAAQALLSRNISRYKLIRDEIFLDTSAASCSYFMKACTSVYISSI